MLVEEGDPRDPVQQMKRDARARARTKQKELAAPERIETRADDIVSGVGVGAGGAGDAARAGGADGAAGADGDDDDDAGAAGPLLDDRDTMLLDAALGLDDDDDALDVDDAADADDDVAGGAGAADDSSTTTTPTTMSLRPTPCRRGRQQRRQGRRRL